MGSEVSNRSVTVVILSSVVTARELGGEFWNRQKFTCTIYNV